MPTLRARRLVSRALASRSLRTKEVDVRHSKLGRIQEHHANVFATVAFAPDQTTRHASSALMRAAPSGSISTTTSSQVCHTAKRTQGNSRRGQPLLRRMAPPVHRLGPTAVPPETWPPVSTSHQVLLTQTWSASDGAPAPLTRLRLLLRSCARRPARPAIFPAMAIMALPAATALPQDQAIAAVATACSPPAGRLLQRRRPQQPHDGPRSGGPLSKTSAGGSRSTSIRYALSHSA